MQSGKKDSPAPPTQNHSIGYRVFLYQGCLPPLLIHICFLPPSVTHPEHLRKEKQPHAHSRSLSRQAETSTSARGWCCLCQLPSHPGIRAVLSSSTSPARWDWGPSGMLKGTVPSPRSRWCWWPRVLPGDAAARPAPCLSFRRSRSAPCRRKLPLGNSGTRGAASAPAVQYRLRRTAPLPSPRQPPSRVRAERSRAAGRRATLGKLRDTVLTWDRCRLAALPAHPSSAHSSPDGPRTAAFTARETKGRRAPLEARSRCFSIHRLSLPSRRIPAFTCTGSGCCPLTSP